MQTMLPFGQLEGLQTFRNRLRPLMGRIRDEHRLDPMSQFVRSFIGSRTYDLTSWNAFVRLAGLFPDWDALADAPEEEIEAVLNDVTFSEKKAPELKLALRKIRVRAGALNLDFLENQPVEQGLFWLEQIHGVGRKIAAATLNFSTMRARAFVVDSHVLRVLRRFGFLKPHASTEDAYDAVMEASVGFDADDLYELHWYLKRLGQKFCTHMRAHCSACPLSESCMQRVEARPAA